MPPRKSDRLLRLAGAHRQDRHGRGAASAKRRAAGAIGKPPTYFDAGLKAIWRELASEAHWLTSADRGALELAVRAVSALRSERSPKPALLAQVGRALDRLALSPGARGENPGIRPGDPRADEPNPLEEFAPSRGRGLR